jgi:hypothetical protein
MSIKIREINELSDLKKFVDFQFDLYKGNKYWVPPLKKEEIFILRKDKNPAFDFCESKYWLAYKSNKIVGRIGAIIHHKYNEKWNKKSARFGWFDFVDDPEIAAKLLETAEKWSAAEGMTELHGPLGFTDMDYEGMLIEGFEEVSTLGALYNYSYYPDYTEKAGYEKDIDWIEFQVTIDKDVVPEKIGRIAQIALKRNNLSLLKVKKAKEFLPYAKEIFYLINEAYRDLYGFVELTDKQIDMYVKQYFGFIIPEYLPVVLDENNKVAAFGITMPSLSKAFQKCKGSLYPFGFLHVLKAIKKNDGLDLYLTAVRPDLQDKGVNAILINEINKVVIKNNIKIVETNRELEDNTKVQAQWRFFNTRIHKKRRCYKKMLV